MTIPILMPALSPTMTEGKLAKWLKAPGDAVAPGDVLAEIETDKATMEVESIDEGVFGQILVPEGTDSVAVNTPIAILLQEGESAADITEAETAPETAPTPQAPAQAAAPVASPKPAPASAPVPVVPPVPQRSGEARLFASPLARRMAAQAGIDLKALIGSGPNGRIVKADVEAVIASGGGQAQAGTATAMPQISAPAQGTAQAPSPAPGAGADVPGMPAYDAQPNSTMRKVIAQRLLESKQTAPHFYLSLDCEIDALLAIRKQLNAKLSDGKISVNDMVIRAAALALKQVPEANASWTEEEIRIYRSVDISVAVAIDGGLITPVVRRAEAKGMAEIAAEMKDLAARARDGKLTPPEYQGGTFSISNLGMHGIREFSAVINPPQGAILAIGAGERRPVVKDNALAIASVMSCTLSVDHRVVDGAIGAAFMAAFKKLIEDPITMLL